MIVREILSDLVAEQQSLDQFLQRIAVRDWKRPTPAEGWSIQDTVSHLAASEELAAEAISGEADLDLWRHADDIDALREEPIIRGRSMRPQDVIEWWRGGRARVVEPLSHMSEHDRIEWIAGSMSAKTLATTRLMETWAHGLDIYAAMDAEVEDSPRIRHIVWLGWKSLPYNFKQAGLAYEEIRLELIGPSYAKWIFGPEDAPNRIKGMAADWARLAVRRSTPEQTRLKVQGEIAEQALTVVCAYL